MLPRREGGEAGGWPPSPLLVPRLGRLTLQGAPSEGGRAFPKRSEEDTGSLALPWECSGPVNLLLGQHPGASSAPRAGAGGGGFGGAGRRGPTHHLGHPAPTCPRAGTALEAPTPTGVSQQLRAGGAAWLHALCIEGHTLTFGERRGEAVWSREGTSFSSKLLSLWAGPPKQVGPHALLQGRGGLPGEG